jgi:hypothetical protein
MKYNIGDIFVDSSFGSNLVSYICNIEYKPNSKIAYYWLRYCCDDEKDNYFTEEELDRTLEDISCFIHYPVKK